MDKYILDTNLFFNMEAGLDLGQKTEDVVRSFSGIVGKDQFFMPPRIVEEFLSFFDNKEQPFIKEFLAKIIIKSPDITRINLTGNIFYELIEDIRERSYRGLRVGEEELVKMAEAMMGSPALDKKNFQIKTGEVVKKFRERYRQSTRFGFIDSLADLDLIVLAKETDGYLVSADEGVISWGRRFGVKELPVSVFGAKMKSFLGPRRQV